MPAVVLTFLLVSLSLLAATPASAETQPWSAEAIPGTTGNVLGPAGIDVRDIAVAPNRTSIYAVAGDSISDNVVYKSTDSGASWTALPVDIQPDLVAIAPDDGNTIVIASTSAPAVYVTTNGGNDWSSLGAVQESGGASASAIYDIAISATSDEKHYIAAAGKEAGDVANVWYYSIGTIAPAWKETNTLDGFSSANVIRAVAFSPNFPSDSVMVTVGESDGVSVNFEIFSLSSLKWNASANFISYPISVVSDDKITGLLSASISLDPAYLGSDYNRHIAFIGLTVDGDATVEATSGVYRLNHTSNTRLLGGKNIHSVDFNGDNLIAGGYDTNAVYYSASPLVTTPGISTVSTYKNPGGESRVVISRMGTFVVAGTSGNESAFAVSSNNGKSFNDISLIDTSITNIRDVAVSADGTRVYLATDDTTDFSLWRRDSSWERVLSLKGAVSNGYIVRMAPEDANTVYVARRDSTSIYYSKDGGKTEWLSRACAVNVQDLAIESAGIIYALSSSGTVSRSSNSGFIWSTASSSGLDSGATIVSVSENNLLVGSADGYVAYSTDSNASWTKIPAIVSTGAGNVQVVADSNFATNRIIYAASDTAGQDIKKWTIGTSTDWTDIFRGVVTGGIYGLAADGGALYALEFNTFNNRSRLWQHLSPALAPGTGDNWNSNAAGVGVHLNAAPRALKVSSGKFWAVKTNDNQLYSFSYILVAIISKAPAPGFINPINPLSGIAYDMTFKWERSSEATEYELDIAHDENFHEIITTITTESELSTVTILVGPNQTGTAKVDFMAGTTYYWRVRATQPLYSQYSSTGSFAVEPLLASVPAILTPRNGSTGVSRTPSFSWEPVSAATEYRFVLSENTTLFPPIADIRVKNAGFAIINELEEGTTYYWAVKQVAPLEGGWSALANFTVKEKAPVPVVPPEVIEIVPPSIINLPAVPSPPRVIISPSPAPAAALPISPTHIWTIIVIGALLATAIIAITVKTFRISIPHRIRAKTFQETVLNYLKAIRNFRITKIRSDKLKRVREDQSIIFAAESFLWMIASKEKEKDEQLLPDSEEKIMAYIIVSRIKNMAKDRILYRKLPKDATLLLHLWARYGSRDETNQYLTRSFQSGKENVIEFLKCYLPSSTGLEPDSSSEGKFSRIHYDSVAKVVNPDNVYEALKTLYGPELGAMTRREATASPEKMIAYQFIRIHFIAIGKTEIPYSPARLN